jgi:hypothetical protein
MTLAERVAALEVKVELMHSEQREISGKLDELLALRNQGLGMLMLVSAVIGTGILGMASVIVGWFRH